MKAIIVMKNIVFLLIFIASLVQCFADTIQSQKEQLQNNVFVKQDSVVTTSTCQFSCRALQQGYIARISNIDATTGTTFCNVYSQYDLSKPLNIQANQINLTCKNNANPTYQGKLSSSSSTYNFTKQNFNSSQTTFSRFLIGLVTLDPDMIDLDTTKQTGILTLNNPNTMYGSNTLVKDSIWNNFIANNEPELVASADSINKSNLGYYASLFSNLSSVYSYLQNFIFIIIGGFFLSVIGSRKLLAYLEKNDRQEKDYLKKFYIIVISVAVFFVPMPESGGNSSTIIQNLIRYFSVTSTQVADKAASIGTNTYLTHIFNSVGNQNAQGEKKIRQNLAQAQAQELQYRNALEFCKQAYPEKLSYSQYYKGNIVEFDLNNKASLIEPQACASIEKNWLVSKKLISQNSHYVSTIEANHENGELQRMLSKINTSLNNRQAELGWVNALLIPSTAIMLDSMDLLKNNQITDAESNNEKIKEINKQDSNNSIWSMSGDTLGSLFSKVVYFILPGAGSTYNFLKEAIEKIGNIGNTALSAIILSSNPIAGVTTYSIIGKILDTATPILSYILTTSIFEFMLKYLPLVVATVAGAIALIGYVVELAKYFYISPFVVVFAMTTRNVTKIVDFFVTGFILFFKPVLIVIFVFFALFAHHLVIDLFINFATEQFGLLTKINNEFFVAFILNIIAMLLQVLGMIASIYIMWKLIVSGPSWVMKLLGIDDKGNSITESITHKLDRYSFQL